MRALAGTRKPKTQPCVEVVGLGIVALVGCEVHGRCPGSLCMGKERGYQLLTNLLPLRCGLNAQAAEQGGIGLIGQRLAPVKQG